MGGVGSDFTMTLLILGAIFYLAVQYAVIMVCIGMDSKKKAFFTSLLLSTPGFMIGLKILEMLGG